MRLRTRLFLGFFLLTGAGFYFLVNWILADLRPAYLDTSEESLIDTANILASLLEAEMQAGHIPADRLRETFQRVYRRPIVAKVHDVVKTQVDLRVYVTDSTGTVLFDSDGGRDEGKDYSRWRDVFLTLHGSYGARSTRLDPKNASTSEMFVGAPIRFENKTIGVLTVSKPSHSVNLFIQAGRPKIIVAGVIASLAVAALGLLLSALVTHPIKQLTDYARSVRDGKTSVLPRLGRSEIGEMGVAFEEMREALEGKKYVEQYVHTLTHELKSPISSVLGAVELLQEPMPAERRAGFLENIRSETDRMQQLVERMLDLSALEIRRGLRETENVDVSELVVEIRDRMRPALERKSLSMTVDSAPGLWVRGERFLLHQALLNLVENAIAFSPEGGCIKIRGSRTPSSAATDSLKTAGEVNLQVTDEGTGIPEFARERVFEKFYSLQRPDSGRKSSGLGLAIVLEITRLHHGTIRLENRPERGLSANWSLPATLPS